MDIKYRIKFHSLWHIGSGESRGADVDMTVLKDHYGFPYIPGKTMKGIIKDAMLDSFGIDDHNNITTRIFGTENNPDNPDDNANGECYFTNAELSSSFKKELIGNKDNLLEFLFIREAKTSISPNDRRNNDSITGIHGNGVAKDGSLRTFEVAVPVILYGEVLNIPGEITKNFEDALGMIKRLGVGRNRGYGSCTVELIEK